MKDAPIVYLACPYAHAEREIMKYRYDTANRAAAKLMDAGIVVFSPLSHSVPIAEILGDRPHEFWMKMDLPLLHLCDEILVLRLPGWQNSLGVIDEMFAAMADRKPITLIEEADIDVLPEIRAASSQYLRSAIFKEKK